jgi:hypothetical protein
MRNKLTYNERLVLKYLSKYKGQWVSPTTIEEAITGKHRSSWASHICIRLSNNGILERDIRGHYCYNGSCTPNAFSNPTNTKPLVDNKNIIRPLKPESTEVDLKCSNGDLYTISTLANGLQIKKNSNSDEKISISTCKGDRIIIGDNTVYIY